MKKAKFILIFIGIFAAGFVVAFQWPRFASKMAVRQVEKRNDEEIKSDRQSAQQVSRLLFKEYTAGVSKPITELPQNLQDLAQWLQAQEFQMSEEGHEKAMLKEMGFRRIFVKGQKAFRLQSSLEEACRPGMFSRLRDFSLAARYDGQFAGRSQFYSPKYAVQIDYETIHNQCAVTALIVPDDGGIYSAEKEHQKLLDRRGGRQ